MNIRSYALAGVFIAVASSVPAAPTPQPGAVLEQQREQREFLRRQQQLSNPKRVPESAVEQPSVDQEKPGAQGQGASFLLEKVQTNPSKVLSDAEIEAITAAYVGHRVTIGALFKMVGAFNQAYREKRVIGAKAVLPPQKIKNGVVQVRLVEGQVGQVEVSDLRDTRADYVTDRVALQPGQVVYMDDLEDRLFRFNALNDIEIRAVLKPGESFGETDYDLRVTEPPRRKYNLFADNAGTKDVGEYRIGFNYTDASATGRRDVLSFGAHLGEGSRGAYASYNMPFGVDGTRLGFSLDYSSIVIVDGPLEPLDVTGDSWNFGTFVSRPLHVGRDYVMNGFVGINVKSSSTDFDGVTLLDTDVRTVSAGIDAQSYDVDGSWYTRQYLTYGPNDFGNDVHFFKYNGEGSWVRIFDHQWTLTLRGKLQLAAQDLLPSSEQFQVGGMSTVRGYPEGLLIGDQGYMVSAEASIPWPGEGSFGDPFSDRLRALVFLDHGAAFPYKGSDQGVNRDDFLTSAGVGVQMNLGKQLRGRLVLAHPLYPRKIDDEDGFRVHFYLELVPF